VRPRVGDVYARAAGLSVSSQEIERVFLTTWPDAGGAHPWWRAVMFRVLEALEFDGDRDAAFDAAQAAFGTAQGWRLFDDVAPVLEGLSARGLRLGVLSNWDARLEVLLADLGIAPYFGPVIVSAVERIAKPDERIFRIAAERAGVAPSAIAYVGDDLRVDVEPARALGMRAFLIDRSGRYAGVHPEPGLSRLTELLSRL
jgi:putative hydrolase of the HAD superfamily